MTNMPEAPKMWRCCGCSIRVPDAELLSAQHPFQPDDVVYACPECREMNELERACVVDGCLSPISSGTPRAHGYRYALACGKHREKSA